ncbi:unnamed protein product [Cyprideis torosa]|uniref:Uncharacterized protein n=1 Tax=Cyprideis torosa TaxID=163714 RepID=A0A7R8ZH83_9CRUS|nr:unnamed protein product [Cyprideis torosa]CAG0881969.1 unnamed protein product [Cyprideis torosa]
MELMKNQDSPPLLESLQRTWIRRVKNLFSRTMCKSSLVRRMPTKNCWEKIVRMTLPLIQMHPEEKLLRSCSRTLTAIPFL